MFGVLPLDVTARAGQHTTSLKKVGMVPGAIAIIFLLCAGSVSGRTQTVSLDGNQTEAPPVIQTTKLSEKPVPHVHYSKNRSTEKDQRVVPPTSYIATAYSLLGRTSSGRPVTRGLIAADPRHLPLGSVVRLDAGAYSGDYLVADTGGTVVGRKIGIWTPTTEEAAKFGRHTVKLTVLSGPDRSPVKIREDLEKEYAERRITEAAYQARYHEYLKILGQAIGASAQYYAERPKLYESATSMPAKLGPVDPREKTLWDSYNERLRSEIDLLRKVISEAEHAERLAEIVKEEDAIAKKNALTASDMIRYYESTDKIRPALALLQNALEKREGWSVEPVFKLATILLALLGTALTFYLSKKKDVREKKLLELETRKLELAEISSRETIEKTTLLLETKQYQVKEMSLRIAQLEQQLSKPGKKLVNP